jgi:catechol 2,3-dioxygenase-like lactoylglutathione lyase family enzyme
MSSAHSIHHLEETTMRTIGLLLCVVSARTFAQTPQSATEPPFTTARGGFFALSVADMEATTRWYSEKLGLKVIMRSPKANGASATVLEGGGLIVELIRRDDAMPLSKAAPGIDANYRLYGFFKAGIIVDDFDRTLRQLRARGVEIAIGPFPATAEQRANVIVKDNAGNYIQFFGPR